MSNSGWIKLHRQIVDNWIWEDADMFKAWIDILLMVNHEDKKIYVNGKLTTIHRGEKLTSITKLSERWRWSKRRVMRFLDLLEEDEMCTLNDLPKGTLVTIENYSKFQGRGTADGTANGTAEGQQKDTIEERKRREKKTRAREGSEGEPSAALEEVEAEGMPDWFKEQVEGTFGKM